MGEVGPEECRVAARELRNYANTLMRMGGATEGYLCDLLNLAHRLDGQSHDDRFTDFLAVMLKLGTGAYVVPEERWR